jgi:CheY-like chemotaxis protein
MRTAPVVEREAWKGGFGICEGSAQTQLRTILLISADLLLYKDLRHLANSLGDIVVRADKLEGLLAVFHAVKPTAVLIDLDLPEQQAWSAAELLLPHQSCPPVILLTAQTGRLDLRTASRAGSLVDKNEGPSRMLQAVEESLELPGTNQAERNIIQRVLIRRLKPSSWTVDIAPAYRFWGINE